ncbi:MAG: gamma carbonic anhydrase family protein [Chryseobacterium sp.]|nr:MAG: gamma carbonic anhydrase family protein [Chryseobacterium sp.]
MALIRELNGKTPQIGDDTFLAETATVIGDVQMGAQCSIWYNAVLRGDVNYIKMGNKVNIQDNVMVHCTYLKSPTNIGNNVSIGHNAIIHGCTIQDNVLIGMGAIVMDDCVVESNAIVAAGAVVTQGTHIKAGELWAGVPAKRIREVSMELIEGEINRIANNYVKYSSWYKED